jgi:hypothetical protein
VVCSADVNISVLSLTPHWTCGSISDEPHKHGHVWSEGVSQLLRAQRQRLRSDEAAARARRQLLQLRPLYAQPQSNRDNRRQLS